MKAGPFSVSARSVVGDVRRRRDTAWMAWHRMPDALVPPPDRGGRLVAMKGTLRRVLGGRGVASGRRVAPGRSAAD